MRIALSMIKWFNHLWNINLTPEQEAEQILKYLLLKNSTRHSIEIYTALRLAMQCEMRKREFQADDTKEAINSLWPKSN